MPNFSPHPNLPPSGGAEQYWPSPEERGSQGGLHPGTVVHCCFIGRACRVTEIGDRGQRFQPKEHRVLILG